MSRAAAPKVPVPDRRLPLAVRPRDWAAGGDPAECQRSAPGPAKGFARCPAPLRPLPARVCPGLRVWHRTREPVSQVSLGSGWRAVTPRPSSSLRSSSGAGAAPSPRPGVSPLPRPGRSLVRSRARLPLPAAAAESARAPPGGRGAVSRRPRRALRCVRPGSALHSPDGSAGLPSRLPAPGPASPGRRRVSPDHRRPRARGRRRSGTAAARPAGGRHRAPEVLGLERHPEAAARSRWARGGAG